MPRLRQRPLTALALLLLVVAATRVQAAGEYRTVEVESLRITIDSEWAVRTAPGYLPVRFDITNLGDARVIEIVGQDLRFFRSSRTMDQSILGIRQAVRLARGDRVRLTLPVPIYAEDENLRLEIHEDGRTLETFNYYGFQSGSAAADASALIVADAQSAFGKAAAGWPRTVAAGPAGRVIVAPAPPSTRSLVVNPGAGPSRTLDFLLAPERLPGNWLGFTSLRAVIIGPAEWEQLNDEQKRALLTWTACGGDLFFVDGDAGALLPGLRQAGSPAAPVRAYFLGRIHTPASASIAARGLSDVLTTAAALQDGNWALPANRASDWGIIGARGFRLSIPGVGGVPTRAYLLILIVFSLLIGPANYWFLWRKRRQVLLVLTAPLISALFIVLLAGYVIAGEGLGVRGRALTFTMLDQVRKEAATRASISLYAAGMAPSGGLRFARDEAVFAIGSDGTGSRESQGLDLTEMQRFASGVIQPRAPTNLEFIGFRPARERLEFDRAGDRVTVVNGLGVAVRALIYRTGDRLHSLTQPLMPGERGVLTAGTGEIARLVPAGVPLSSRLAHLFNAPPDGSYLAMVERSPFWNAGVENLDERDSFHVVMGWVGGQP